MNNLKDIKILKITIPLIPRTNKNSQRIFKTPSGRLFIAPSKAYKDYENDCKYFRKRGQNCPLSVKVNVKAIFYMPTKRRVDLVNLEEAILDILVKYEILEDDNCKIVVSMDGSRVDYDKDNPRTEIEIKKLD